MIYLKGKDITQESKWWVFFQLPHYVSLHAVLSLRVDFNNENAPLCENYGVPQVQKLHLRSQTSDLRPQTSDLRPLYMYISVHPF